LSSSGCVAGEHATHENPANRRRSHAPHRFDETAATQRLAEAVRFKTVAPAKPDQLDAKPLLALHPFLRASFPGVHRALGREVVNDHSLLYAWPGTDATRKPISLMAHLDVVPVESAAEREWIEPLFSGRIADGYLGRGSTDDKSAVLGILEAVEARGRRCSAQPRMPCENLRAQMLAARLD
jgi:carboxypeptidase PM20D1